MNIKKIIYTIIIVILIISLIVLYSRFIATTGLKVKEYKIVNNNITEDFHGLKVVQISDIHYGRTVKLKEIKKIVNQINLIKPDIVVLTGDLMDRDTKVSKKSIEKLEQELSKINAKYGKYAITGNHDYTKKDFDEIIEKSNFTNINNNYDRIYDTKGNYIMLSGISTIKEDKITLNEKLAKTNEYLDNISIDDNIKEPIYKILLIHEPDIVKDLDYSKYNLILAGHSHNGQVRLPVIGPIILPPGAKTYYDEYYKLNNTDLYISSGLGTSNADFRLFNRPSFNLYRICNH